MQSMIVVQIIGAPVPCQNGVKDSWREVAEWAGRQLRLRYGETVRVKYFDLFDPDCPVLPPNSQLPVVLVNDVVVSNGGKISLPLIRKKIEGLG